MARRTRGSSRDIYVGAAQESASLSEAEAEAEAEARMRAKRKVNGLGTSQAHITHGPNIGPAH